jgi:hypothetical protein
VRLLVRNSLVANSEQSSPALFRTLFASMKLSYVRVAIRRFRNELLETRLCIRGASGQVNLLTGESVAFSALHTS